MAGKGKLRRETLNVTIELTKSSFERMSRGSLPTI